MQTLFRTLARRPLARALAVAAAATSTLALTQRDATAQAIVMSVNGDPITSVDLDQQTKLQRALHRPATRDATIESIIADRLKHHEAARYGIDIKDNEIGEQVQTEAKRIKMAPQALVAAIAKAGVTPEQMRYHFKAGLGYSVLIRALNRGVEASEIAVRDELSKEKTKGGETSYTIRQIVFTSSPEDPPSVIEANVKQAQALRGRFNSCETGIPYAKNLPGVAVRTKVTRTASQLSDGIREILDKTPLGHLTEPSRSPNGIEMVALCERTVDKSDDSLRKVISDRILARHFEDEEARKYKELRATAVINRSP